MLSSTKLVLSALSALTLVGATSGTFAAPDPAPAAAPADQATTVAPATVKANPEDKVICKTETPIGSRLGGKRTCMKKSDWDLQSQNARNQRDFQPPAGISGAH